MHPEKGLAGTMSERQRSLIELVPAKRQYNYRNPTALADGSAHRISSATVCCDMHRPSSSNLSVMIPIRVGGC